MENNEKSNLEGLSYGTYVRIEQREEINRCALKGSFYQLHFISEFNDSKFSFRVDQRNAIIKKSEERERIGFTAIIGDLTADANRNDDDKYHEIWKAYKDVIICVL